MLRPAARQGGSLITDLLQFGIVEDDVCTYSQLLSVCEQATILTHTLDGYVQVFIDQLDRDTRFIFEHEFKTTWVDRTVLRYFDAEKRVWTHMSPKVRLRLKNKQGRKKLRDWLQALAKDQFGFFDVRRATYYRRQGRLLSDEAASRL